MSEFHCFFWLLVSTHLKNMSQIGSFPRVGVKTRKNVCNHHLVFNWPLLNQKNQWLCHPHPDDFEDDQAQCRLLRDDEQKISPFQIGKKYPYCKSRRKWSPNFIFSQVVPTFLWDQPFKKPLGGILWKLQPQKTRGESHRRL